MKILLVNPPIREWAKPNVFPLGLGYIAAALVEDHHCVEVLDINAHRFSKEEVEEKVKNADFDVVGIGGLITVYKYLKWLVAILKKYHPDKKIIVGGSVGTSVSDIVLGHNAVDIVCINEGEHTIRDLIRSLEDKQDLSGVQGIFYKDKNGRICKNVSRPAIDDLDTLPMPAWGYFPIDIYLCNPLGALNRNKWLDGRAADNGGQLSINLSASRGCPYQCIYCYHDFMGQRYRHRSAENILQEIKALSDIYNVTYFHFIDDEFVADRRFVYEFCNLMKNFIKSTGKKLTWGCTGRVNLMAEDLIVAMSTAGCISIGYGIESGSQRMLDVINKKVTIWQAKEAIRITKKYLGWADCSFMIGYPGETKQTIQETIDFCKELDLSPEVIFFLTPYPGTKLYQMALQQGKIGDEETYVLGLDEQGEKIVVNFTDFTDEELYKIQAYMIEELGAWNKMKHIQL